MNRDCVLRVVSALVAAVLGAPVLVKCWSLCWIGDSRLSKQTSFCTMFVVIVAGFKSVCRIGWRKRALRFSLK